MKIQNITINLLVVILTTILIGLACAETQKQESHHSAFDTTVCRSVDFYTKFCRIEIDARRIVECVVRRSSLGANMVCHWMDESAADLTTGEDEDKEGNHGD